MVETGVSDTGLPPKWRSSMAIYDYVVPEDQTADQYPDRRIVYLKLTASITGWCPNEDLKQSVDVSNADPYQVAGWQAVKGTGWASKYWPCVGAIAQLAIYPNPESGVALDDYPYIVDFEPKKRELYEAVSNTSEILSGSSNRIGTQKGTTTTDTTEMKVDIAAQWIGGGVSAGVSNTSSDQTVDNRSTDTSQEKRETQSHSTQFSQMYQLFNGYHLGTNRAVFIVFPRPHTASSADQIDQNLIDGERKLEGIQEMFLVVSLPRATPGICVRAWLDTGHRVPSASHQTTQMAYTVQMAKNDGTTDDRLPDGGDGGVSSGGGGSTGSSTTSEIIMTRRSVAGCGTFDGDALSPAPVPPPPHRLPGTIVSGLISVDVTSAAAMRSMSTSGPSKEMRPQLANDLNTLQSRIRAGMLDAWSSGAFEPAPFTRSVALWTFVPRLLRDVAIDLDDLLKHGYLDASQRAALRKARIDTTAQVFAAEQATPHDPGAAKIAAEVRGKLLQALWKLVKKPNPK